MSDSFTSIFPASENVPPLIIGAHKYLLNEWLDERIYCPDECSSKQGIKRENKSTAKDKKGESKSGSWWALQDPQRAAMLTAPGASFAWTTVILGTPPPQS